MISRIQRRMAASLLISTDPSTYYGTSANPLIFWNMCAIWRHDDGRIMRCDLGMTNNITQYSGMMEHQGPFSDGLRGGERVFGFSPSFFLERPLYIDPVGNRVLTRREETQLGSHRIVKFFRVVRNQSNVQTSKVQTGETNSSNQTFSGSELRTGFNILGNVTELSAPIIGIGTQFQSTEPNFGPTTPTVPFEAPGIGSLVLFPYSGFGSFWGKVSLSTINGVTTDWAQIYQDGREDDAYLIDRFSSRRINDGTGPVDEVEALYNGSSDYRIRLLGRALSANEISASRAIILANGAIVSP